MAMGKRGGRPWAPQLMLRLGPLDWRCGLAGLHYRIMAIAGGERGATRVVASEVGRSYLRLHLVPDVGPIRARRLVDHFGSPEGVFAASRAEWMRVEGIGPKIAEALAEHWGEDAADREIARAAACGVRILCPMDGEYPAALRHIPDAPLALYVRGSLESADAVAVAIVGTRKCSLYGREQAVRFAELLAGAGFTVVSGLARGVDGHAHRGALNAGGRTLAVLGNGLPAVYPPEHEALAREVEQHGALVTEAPMDGTPSAESFPRRNRIIAGLTLGTLVIEAGKKSGALITARLANEYNREVFAVPGRVDQPDLSAGVNKLIRDGQAKLVTSLDDVLDELGAVGERMREEAGGTARPEVEKAALGDEGGEEARDEKVRELSATERRLLALLARDTLSTDELAESCGAAVPEVHAALTALELKGRVSRLPGSRYAARRGC